MQVDVQLDAGGLRTWHVDLVERLAVLPGVQVAVRPVDGAPDGGARAERLMALERLLHRLDAGPLGPVEWSVLSSYARAATTPQADLVVDLSSGAGTPRPVWTVTYDGVPGEQAALGALRAGRMPLISLTDSAGSVVAQGRAGSEQPGLLTTALADVAAGAAALVVGAVQGQRFAEPSAHEETAAPPASFASLAVRRAVGAARHRAYHALYRAPHWRVGWRFVDGPDVFDLGGHPDAGWNDLPDDGHHFYADPFPFEHEGRVYLFVEDFDHRVGKGVISVVEYDDAGPIGTPRPVLTHDVHLSYPFVVEHEGEIWMIPETSAAATVELYRATRFPDAWEREAVLLTGVEASDATVFTHEGRWWMTATVRSGGSFSDALHLWSAADLMGPWRAHAANPVLLDIAGARPAGRVVQRGGRLLRPVQDCRRGYGAALAIAEITRLDDEAFEQRVVARLGPSERWPGRRLHTLNRAGRLEVVDGSGMAPRFWPRRPTAPAATTFAVQREDDFDFLSVEYADLFERSDATPFQHGLWLDQLYSSLAPTQGARKNVVTVRRADDQLVAVLPLVRRRSGGVRLVEYADLGVADYAAPVIDRSAVDFLREDRSISRRIRQALGRFDALRIERVADSPAGFERLFAGARSREHLYGTHLVKLAGSVDTWRDGLEPQFVHRLDKAYKRLRAKGEHTFRTIADPAEVEPLMVRLQSLRAARFSGTRTKDVMQEPEVFQFYLEVARRSVATGGPGRLSVVELGQETAAIAFDLADGDRDLHLLVGYDRKRLNRCSIGLLMVDQLISAAIGRGQAHYDLTVGDEAYKAEFGAVARPLFEVYVTRTFPGWVHVTGRTHYLRARRFAKHTLATWEARKAARRAAAETASKAGSKTSG